MSKLKAFTILAVASIVLPILLGFLARAFFYALMLGWNLWLP